MALFSLVVDVDRSVHEQYKVTITAGDKDEAQDLVYDWFMDFPDSDFVLDSVIRIKQDTHSIEIENMDFEKSGIELVFQDGENDDGGDEIA